MDFETILAIAVCVLVYIGIPTLLIRKYRKKKKAKEADKRATWALDRMSRSTTGTAKEDRGTAISETSKKASAKDDSTSRVKTAPKAPTEKKAPEKKTEPKKTAPEKKPESTKAPEKKPASRVKTDPAFSDKKPSEKPKTAPKEKPKPQKPRTDMETETLLRVEKGKKDYWKCYYCGTENEKTAHRCVVCAQEKPPMGI